jgi:hypothetical protein
MPELGDTFQVEEEQKCSFSCINIKSLNLRAVMNYLKVYCNLIRKAENRVPPEGYTEKHHVFPKSIFGDNKRIVVLTAREHYIAHALLEKIYIKRYGLKDKKTIKMICAHIYMKGGDNYINSYLYMSARKRRSLLMSGENNFMYGRNHTDESKEKIRISRIGKKRSKKTREKLRIIAKNRKQNPMLGKKQSPESRAKISTKNKGRKISNEMKEYLSKRNSGENNPYYGRKHSTEIIEKMSGENHYKSMWWKIAFEDGRIVEICGLTTWAKINGYNCSALRRLASGKKKKYKDIVSIEKLAHRK